MIQRIEKRGIQRRHRNHHVIATDRVAAPTVPVAAVVHHALFGIDRPACLRKRHQRRAARTPGDPREQVRRDDLVALRATASMAVPGEADRWRRTLAPRLHALPEPVVDDPQLWGVAMAPLTFRTATLRAGATTVDGFAHVPGDLAGIERA